MKMIALSFVVSLALAAPLAQAQGIKSQPDAVTSSQALVLPPIQTQSGRWFSKVCNDDAFAAADDQAGRAKRCAKLLAQWRSEAQREGWQDVQPVRHSDFNPGVMFALSPANRAILGGGANR